MKKVISKRIKVTKSGKLLRRKMGGGHLGSTKSNKQKMSLRGDKKLHKADYKGIIAELVK